MPNNLDAYRAQGAAEVPTADDIYVCPAVNPEDGKPVFVIALMKDGQRFAKLAFDNTGLEGLSNLILKHTILSMGLEQDGRSFADFLVDHPDLHKEAEIVPVKPRFVSSSQTEPAA